MQEWEKVEQDRKVNLLNPNDHSEYKVVIKSSILDDGNFREYYHSNENKDSRESVKRCNYCPTIEKKGSFIMDEGYKKLFDRLDQDMRDHKQEIRDRDARLQTEIAEREARYHKESAEREDRIMAAIADSGERMRNEMSEIRQTVNRSEGYIHDTEKHIQTMVTQNRLGRIGTIVTILAICATIGVTIWAAVWSVSRNQPIQQTSKQSETQK
jgi:hypothetical protein